MLARAVVEAAECGTALKILAAVDTVLARHNFDADGCAALRGTLIKEVTDVVEFRAGRTSAQRCGVGSWRATNVKGLEHDPVH